MLLTCHGVGWKSQDGRITCEPHGELAASVSGQVGSCEAVYPDLLHHCGAMPFRKGLASALAEAGGPRYEFPYGRECALAFAHALAHVHPVPGEPSPEEAVRLILYEVWYILWPVGTPELDSILEGTWAGEVLSRMRAHYQAHLETRRRWEEQNSPARLRQCREEKQRLRQEKEKKRLARKKEIDRIWWETHKRDES